MFGKSSNAEVVAVVGIGGGSAGVAIVRTGTSPELLAYAREDLPLENRTKDALRSGVIQALGSAGDKALASYAKGRKMSKVSACYCVIEAPWTRSFGGSASSRLEHQTTITDEMISSLAKQALADQKDIGKGDLFEANVSRVLLNGYPTSDPAGKRAQTIDALTLLSDCDAGIKSSAAETLAKLFPGTPLLWRSSARAALAAAKEVTSADASLIVEVSQESTDVVSIRKGALDQRVLVEQGTRQILTTLGKGKPAEETLSLIQMLEKDQCDNDACEELKQAIAKAEPDLVHLFGEAFAKISTPRKLTDELILIAAPALLPWFTRFFARIDFTQFTATTRPFSVKAFPAATLSGVPHDDPTIFNDPGLCIACNLVNMELSS